MAFLSGIASSLGGVGLGSAVVAVAVDTAPLKAGLESAKAEVAASTSSMSAATKAIGTGFIVAGAAAVLAMGKAVSSTMQLAMATRGLQRVTGQTAESASSLLFVAHELGVDAASLTQGFGLLAKNIDMNAPVLAKFGLVTKDASGATLDFNTILGEAADKYLALGGGLTGAAFAMELFGRGGKALIPILNEGSAGIAELEAAAQKYGIVLSQDTIDNVITLAHAQRELSSSVQGLQVSIGTALIPVMTTFAHLLTGVVTAIGKIPGPVVDAILIFTALTGAFFLLQKAAALVAATWGPVIAAMGLGTTAMGTQAAAATLDANALLGLAAAEEAAGAGFVAIAATAAAAATAVGGYVVGFSGAGETLATMTEKLNSVGVSTKYMNAMAIVAAYRTKAMAGAFGEASSAAITATPPTDNLALSEEELAAQAKAAADALAAQKAAQLALLPGILGLIGNTQTLAAAQKQLTHDMNVQHPSMVTIRADQLALLNAQQGLNTSLKDEAQKLLDSGKSTDFVITKLDGLASKAGMSGGAINRLNGYVQGLIDKLNAIPKSVTSTVTINERHNIATFHK